VENITEQQIIMRSIWIEWTDDDGVNRMHEFVMKEFKVND